MTIKENIKAILACNFSGFKEEIIETATNKIMEIVNTTCSNCDYCYSNGYTAGYLKGKEEKQPQGKWIPVSERLPEYKGLYLISVDDIVVVAHFTGAYFLHGGAGRIKVDAWQPLPEPYKKSGE